MRLVSLFLCRCLCPWLAAPYSGLVAHSLPPPSQVLGVKDLGGLSVTQAFRGSREGSYTDATRLGVFTANPNSPIPLQYWRMNSDQGFCNTHPQRASGRIQSRSHWVCPYHYHHHHHCHPPMPGLSPIVGQSCRNQEVERRDPQGLVGSSQEHGQKLRGGGAAD